MLGKHFVCATFWQLCFKNCFHRTSTCVHTNVYTLVRIQELRLMKSELWAQAPQYVCVKENQAHPVFTIGP